MWTLAGSVASLAALLTVFLAYRWHVTFIRNLPEGLRRQGEDLSRRKTVIYEDMRTFERLVRSTLVQLADDSSRHKKARRRISGRTRHKRSSPWRETCWFQKMMLFVPREVRSPALDHILEDRREASSRGCPRFLIETSTVIKCVWLVALVVWGFLWDVLNPFKSRSRISGND
jgi:hypothetical protein